MVRYFSFKLTLFFMIFCLSIPSVFAGDIRFYWSLPSIKMPIYSGLMNGLLPGEGITDEKGVEWVTNQSFQGIATCDLNSQAIDKQCQLTDISYTVQSPMVSGIQYHDGAGNYSVYKLNAVPPLENVGMAIGIKTPNDTQYYPLTGVQGHVRLPVQPIFGTTGLDISIRLVSTNGEMKFDTQTTVNRFTIFTVTFTFQDENGKRQTKTTGVSLEQFSFQSHSLHCMPSEISPIKLGSVNINEIPHINDVSNTVAHTTLGLSCGSNSETNDRVLVQDHVYIAVSDLNDPSVSSKESLKNDECDDCAKGIGVKLFLSGDTSQSIKIIPPTSVRNTLGQIHIENPSHSTTLSQSIYARVVRTDQQVTAGKIHAIAQVTYTYQ